MEEDGLSKVVGEVEKAGGIRDPSAPIMKPDAPMRGPRGLRKLEAPLLGGGR